MEPGAEPQAQSVGLSLSPPLGSNLLVHVLVCHLTMLLFPLALEAGVTKLVIPPVTCV